MQKGIFVMLVIIAFLLGANLFKGKESTVQDSKVKESPAPIKKIEYKTVSWTTGEELQKKLDKFANDGWEYVGNGGGYPWIIFKKIN